MRGFGILFGLILMVAACGPSIDLSAIPEQADAPSIYTIGPAQKIRIVGSSTVAPFSTTVAEHFGATSEFASPIVESTGTGGGFKLFCQSLGPNEPSIVNASRQIKPSESALCETNGISAPIEVMIGYDGIVLANQKGAPGFDLSKAEVFRGLAAKLPDGRGGWMKNPNKTWRDVSPDLPDMKILVSGPPPTSGTRDAFVEITMVQGALDIPEMRALQEADLDAFRRRAHEIRNDGAWIDSGENDSTIINTLVRNEDALGLLGYSFLQQNVDRIKAAQINGVAPNFETIAKGEYTVSRSMFFYVKRENAVYVPGLLAFVDEFTQDYTWGETGYLVGKGLIPLSPSERAEIRERLALQFELSRTGPE